ncbi:hypothetical protein V5R22_31170 [Bacillus thuringiensis]|uniref:Uncharacterized protein n=4 Tax=Bacillus cereus group TaxID=86661 RepID=A0AAP4V4W5_BACTU|nr:MULTISPECIES: hypothetical protein [Bacillus]AFV22107.1 hypothetical protein BTB_78p00350 [Bacillus thuringiensis Bt407]AJA23687.1 hypothetical protein BT4G5_33365 [Bacillus thuringiensis serovar galleriae]ARP61787.1 hypothetical protein CAB88_32850 [Bacillus thuringiensis]AST05422.1 hypothetical protein BT10792_34380 [Bacillus thuringiensis]EEM31917.1 hypothetical protein bthur0003_55720 [Bacillus thuringiensis serovar thuringiensis str. T01001]
MNIFSLMPIIIMAFVFLFIMLCLLVNVIFLYFEKELPDPLKLALPGMLTCLILLLFLHFIK